MTFTSTPITIKDGASADQSLIAFNDGTSSAFAHPVLDDSGAIISPATSGKQDTGNSHLSEIETATEATVTALTAANASLDAIEGAGAKEAKQDTAITHLSQIETATESSVTALVSAVAALEGIGSDGAKEAKQDEANSRLDTANGKLDTANAKLDTLVANTGAGCVSLTSTPAVTAGAYSTGMVAGGKVSLANAVRVAGGSGIIQSVIVSKKTALTAPFDVYFFHTDPTNSTFTDHSALALNVADLPFLIGVAQCTTAVDHGTPKSLQAMNLAMPFKLAAGTTLYAVPVIRGGETYASTSALVLNVGILQD